MNFLRQIGSDINKNTEVSGRYVLYVFHTKRTSKASKSFNTKNIVIKMIYVIQQNIHVCTHSKLKQSQDLHDVKNLFVLRFYGPVNPRGSCRARSVYLTTRLLGRLGPLSGSQFCAHSLTRN